jgi:enoyl-CoA hydratase
MSIEVTRPEAGIALVTLCNEAHRNAFSPDDLIALGETWPRLADDPAVRCVIVTGRGTRAFCSGAQLGADFSHIAEVDDLVCRALLKTVFFPKPLVAAVNGHCVAGGFELMMASDIRIASVDARLGLPEVHWGIVPSGGGAMKLIEQIGHARAMELLLTAELISADTARQYGIVNHVVPADAVLDTALALARRIASNSPMAVRFTKESALLQRASGSPALEAEERRRVAIMRASDDARIGVQAFLAKERPVY